MTAIRKGGRMTVSTMTAGGSSILKLDHNIGSTNKSIRANAGAANPNGSGMTA